jgi:hypothetical protein
MSARVAIAVTLIATSVAFLCTGTGSAGYRAQDYGRQGERLASTPKALVDELVAIDSVVIDKALAAARKGDLEAMRAHLGDYFSPADGYKQRLQTSITSLGSGYLAVWRLGLMNGLLVLAKNATRAKDAVTFLETAKTTKEQAEKTFRSIVTAAIPPPKVSLNTLHSFDLSPAQQTRLAVAATTPNGTDTTDPNQLNADTAIKNAYASNGFAGRHERDYARVGVSNPSNPDTWPQGQTVLTFVALDLFKTAAGAAKAAEASRLDADANDFAPITGSPLGEGEVVLQKIPAGSDVLSTIVVLQRGQVVVKIASACRGCPLGTVPADAAAFIKAQISQAEAKGLPKS